MAAADAVATALALQQLQPRNTSLNSTNETAEWSELMYRHTPGMTALYCVAYLIVFAVGLVGNCFVVAVVMRSPRMRTVTNYFIVNLALADILVIVFCLPATLMSNIYVREYNYLLICVFVLLLFFLCVGVGRFICDFKQLLFGEYRHDN